MGVLYRYELTNGFTYIGRDLSENVTSNNFRRAKDHFYNAVVAAYGGRHLYHNKEDFKNKLKFNFMPSSYQEMEFQWSQLIKQNSDNFSSFSKKFFEEENSDYNESNWVKDFKKDITITKTSINKDNKKVQALRKKMNQEQNIIMDNKIDYQLSVPRESLEIMEKKFKSIIKKEEIGLISWKVKNFKNDDNFWLLKKNNPEPFNYITTAIKSATDTIGLQDTALGEYLLISLDMTTGSGLFTSLNREIGQFSKIYTDLISKYSWQELTNIQREVGSEISPKTYKDLSKVININIGKEFENNIIQHVETNINTEKFDQVKLEKIGIDYKIDNPIKPLLEQWFSKHQDGAESYWNNAQDLTQQMLKESFKYTLIMRNLDGVKQINKTRKSVIKERKGNHYVGQRTKTNKKAQIFKYSDLD